MHPAVKMALLFQLVNSDSRGSDPWRGGCVLPATQLPSGVESDCDALMSSVPSLVSEIVRAANVVEHLATREIEDLLLRAIATIRDLRDVIGIPVNGTEHDAVIRLSRLASAAEGASRQEIRDGLREAADMVRTLWIVVDSGTEISLTPSR